MGFMKLTQFRLEREFHNYAAPVLQKHMLSASYFHILPIQQKDSHSESLRLTLNVSFIQTRRK